MLGNGVAAQDMAILVPYAAQIELVKSMLDAPVEVSSIDRSQGKERRIIIYNSVRGNESGKLGFVADRRRLNVALTRDHDGLICVCNTTTLASDRRTT